jgi:hypothetical protein
MGEDATTRMNEQLQAWTDDGWQLEHVLEDRNFQFGWVDYTLFWVKG